MVMLVLGCLQVFNFDSNSKLIIINAHDKRCTFDDVGRPIMFAAARNCIIIAGLEPEAKAPFNSSIALGRPAGRVLLFIYLNGPSLYPNFILCC